MLKHAPRKVLTQPRSKHEVSLQNDSPGPDHCCFIKTFDRVILWIRLINLYSCKVDSFTLPMQLESSKTELRFENYGRLKIDQKNCTDATREVWHATRFWPLTSIFPPETSHATREPSHATRKASGTQKNAFLSSNRPTKHQNQTLRLYHNILQV
jgi:hypothetical protein